MSLNLKAARLALLFAVAGLGIAYGILVALGAIAIFSKPANSIAILAGAGGCLVAAPILGSWAGNRARMTGKRGALLAGIAAGVLTLETGTLIGTLPGLIFGSSFGFVDAIVCWVVKSVFWINVVGLVPAIFLGAFFGTQLGKMSRTA